MEDSSKPKTALLFDVWSSSFPAQTKTPRKVNSTIYLATNIHHHHHHHHNVAKLDTLTRDAEKLHLGLLTDGRKKGEKRFNHCCDEKSSVEKARSCSVHRRHSWVLNM